MSTDLATFAAERGVKYFMISFTDLFGGQRAKLVPAQAIAGMQEEGAGFAGFATPSRHDARAPRHAGRAGPGLGRPAAVEPRGRMGRGEPRDGGGGGRPGPPQRPAPPDRGGGAARDALSRPAWRREYFLLTPDGSAISDEYDTAAKPCYDQQAVMRRYDVVREICDYMLDLGWGPYQNDHEDANGQFEMNWEFDDALATADKHSFFKFMTKSVAEKHGFRATFMPKPVEGADRQWLPYTCVCLGRARRGRQDQHLRHRSRAGQRHLGAGSFGQGPRVPWRDHEARRRDVGDHQSDGQQLTSV